MRDMRMQRECEFYNVMAPFGIWAALGAQSYLGNDETGYQVDWGAHRGEQRAAYAMELIERARDELGAERAYNQGDNVIVMRRVMTLYGKDRMARTLSALTGAINEISITVEGDRLASALTDFAASVSR